MSIAVENRIYSLEGRVRELESRLEEYVRALQTWQAELTKPEAKKVEEPKKANAATK